MTLKTIGVAEILPENERTYYNYLIGFLDSMDLHCSLLINKSSEKVSFRVTPSHPEHLPYILRGIKELHTKFGIRVEFSKSIKTSQSICFLLSL